MRNKDILLIILIFAVMLVVGISIKKSMLKTEGFDEEIEDIDDITDTNEIIKKIENTDDTEPGIIDSVVNKVSEIAGSVSETVGGVVNSVSGTVGNVVSSVTQTVSDTVGSMTSTSDEVIQDNDAVIVDDLTGNSGNTIDEIIKNEMVDINKLTDNGSSNSEVVGIDEDLTRNISESKNKRRKNRRNQSLMDTVPPLTTDFDYYNESTTTYDLDQKLKNISEMTRITEDIQGYYDNPGYYYIQ